MPTLKATLDSDIKNGSYYGPQRLGGMKGKPGITLIKEKALNRNNATKPWQKSE